MLRLRRHCVTPSGERTNAQFGMSFDRTTVLGHKKLDLAVVQRFVCFVGVAKVFRRITRGLCFG